jgi:hypothetical protein
VQLRKSLIGAVVAVLAAPLVVAVDLAPSATAVGTAAASSWAGSWSAVPHSSGTPLASGVLKAGQRKSADATVILFAEPGSMAVPSGAVVSERAVSRATTDGSGKWQLGVPAGTDLTRYADKVGIVNFEVQSFDGVGSDLYIFPGQVITRASLARTAAGRRVSTVHGLSLGGKAVSLFADTTLATGIRLNSQRMPSSGSAVSRVTAAAVSPQVTVCTTTGLTTTRNVKTWVGYTSNGGGSTFTFFYRRGSTSTFGVGVSSSGAFGSFNASGSVTLSTNDETEYAPSTLGNENYYAYFDVQRYFRHCVTARVGVTTNGWFTRASKDDGGSAQGPAPLKPMGQCTLVGPGQTKRLNYSKAFTSQSGLNTAPIIGINLSAQSGYNTETEVDMKMGPRTRPFCGLYDLPGGRPGLLQVH